MVLEIAEGEMTGNNGFEKILFNYDTLSKLQRRIADYIVSEEVCVERKTISDLVDSIIDGRVFSQAREMTNCFEKPIMIIEGDLREGFKRIGENQLTGAILSIIMDFRIGFLITRDERETAIAIYNLARREQEKGSKPKIKIPKKSIRKL